MQIIPRYLLCDMDGTLIDTEILKFHAWHSAIGEAHGSMPDETAFGLEYAELVGAPAMHMSHAFIESWKLDMTPEALHDIRERYRVEAYANPETLRGLVRSEVVSLVENMRDGMRVMGSGQILLVTTATQGQVDTVMAATDLCEMFDHVVCGFEKSRENPVCYREALSLLNCRPEECLALEDTIHGYEAARAVGVPCILLPNTFVRMKAERP
jgi:beta-phosphoglucomutase-like phosphatase (HAD superfamily)